MIVIEGRQLEPHKKPSYSEAPGRVPSVVRAEDINLPNADAPNRNRTKSIESIPTDEAEQTAFFHRTLELMDVLDHVTERDAFIMHIQLWVTGGHTAIDEWYRKIGERLCTTVFIEDLPDLTKQQRAAVTEFMMQAKREFEHRPKDAGPARRVGWMKRIFTN